LVPTYILLVLISILLQWKFLSHPEASFLYCTLQCALYCLSSYLQLCAVFICPFIRVCVSGLMQYSCGSDSMHHILCKSWKKCDGDPGID
jgi:hypothetical protein